MKFMLANKIVEGLMCQNKLAQAFSLLTSTETDREVITSIENTTVTSALFQGILDWLLSFFSNFIYAICKFAMNIIDFFQTLAYKLIGVGTIDEYQVVDQNNPLIKFLTSEVVLDVFISIMIVAIVFLIVFTIIAIVRSEYQTATGGDDNSASKGRILRRVFRALGAMILYPCVLLASIILINAILASVISAFNVNPNATVGSNIFIASAYNANNYRNYAINNSRIPILINFEDPQMYTLNGDSGYTSEELDEIYKAWEETGKSIYSRFAYSSFSTFSDTVYYKNNIIHNNNDYSGFEKFVCTPEQYQVMADFIDYAVANNMTFYIKAYDDPDVDWGYVSNSVYNPMTQTFTINYTNSTGGMGTGDYYTMVYQAEEFEFDTPMQAIIQTINQILSIGEFEDYQFKMLERVDDERNLVEWKTEKVVLKLSENWQTAPTALDQLILYEYSRKLANNTFNDYYIEDFLPASDGVELKVMTLHNTRYSPSLKQYVEYATHYVCYINGSYYAVSENQTYLDGETQTIYTIDEDLLTGTYFEANSTTLKQEYVPTASEELDVVTIDALGGIRVKLPTDENGKASLYADLRVNYNSGDSKYDEIYNTSVSGAELDDGIKVYVDTLEDVCVTGTWTEKIYNDLQVIYKDININNLINTDQWLSAFSEMYNSQSYITTENGQTATTTFNTTLIHPLGLIQAELFLGNVEEGQYYNSYADFIYSSSYNDSIIKALFISLLGEENYRQSYQQYQVYMDIFNCMMSSVLDETAFYEFFDIVDETNQSLQLYTYKAYLSSVLLSTDFGNYLYNIADTIMKSNNVLNYILQREIDENGNVTSVQYVEFYDMIHSIQDIETVYGKYFTFSENTNAYGISAIQGIKDGAIEEFMADYPDAAASLTDAENILNSMIDSYTTTLEYINTFETVNDYWQGQEFEHGDDYEFLEALEIYMSEDGFARSWAMGPNGMLDKSSIANELSEIVSWYDKNELVANDIITFFGGAVSVEELEAAYRYLLLDETDEGYDEALQAGLEAQAEIEDYVSFLRVYRWLSGVAPNGVIFPVKMYYVFNAYSKLNDFLSLIDTLQFLNEQQTDASVEVATIDFTSAYNLLGHADEFELTVENCVDLALSVSDNVWKEILGENLFNQIDDVLNISNGRLVEVSAYCENTSGERYTSSEEIMALKKLWYQMLLIYNDADITIDEQNNLSAQVKNARGIIKNYVGAQLKLDTLNLYNVYYSITAFSSQVLNETLVLNINNRKYVANVNMSSAKFVEYILGYDKLVEYGYTPVYIDDTYQGILSQTSVTINGEEIYTTDTWAELKQFLNKFGQACIDISNKSTFARLENDKVDTFTLDLYTITGSNQVTETTLSLYLAQFIADNLSTDILTSFVKIDSTIINTNNESVIRNEVKRVLANTRAQDPQAFRSIVIDLLDYLGLDKDFVARICGVDTTDVNFKGFTLSQYKTAAMRLLYDYQEYAEDSSYANQQRYVTLVYLCCADWQESASFNGDKWVKPENSQDLNAFYNSNITSLKKDDYSLGLIMRMSGLENRNPNELVGLEFTVDLTSSVKSEENGDVFIICTYDANERKYYPFLMANNELNGIEQNDVTQEYIDKFIRGTGLTMPYTNYYGGVTDENGNVTAQWYPVVAKGIVTEDGIPTTIKESNGDIVFYRNDVVIRDASVLQLSTYFSDTSAIIYRGGIISVTANAITKAIYGKTLSEIAISRIPRITLESGLHFAYGNDYNEVATVDDGVIYIDYNFYENNGLAMEFLFNSTQINMLILVLAVIALFKALWSMVWGLISRIFDVTVLSMLSPAVFATMALTPEEKKDGQYADKPFVYDNWLATVRDKLLSVFGFAIAINIFFIMVPIIREFNLFSSASAFANIPLVRNISANALNAIVQTILLICAIYTIKSAPKLFEGFIGVESNLQDSGDNTLKNVKGIEAMVRDYTSGRAIVRAKNKAIGLVQSLPGAELGAEAASAFRTARTRIQARRAAAHTRDALIANGVSRRDARRLARTARQTLVNSQQADEARRRQRRVAYRRAAFGEFEKKDK